MSAFNEWIDTYLEEKAVDMEQHLEVEGPSGLNLMPASMIVDAIKHAPRQEQESIKRTLVILDYRNGDPLHFLSHLGQALAR